jgi:small conductance mechanosensitive channel
MAFSAGIANIQTDGSAQQFFHNLVSDWLATLKNFLHDDLPKLVGVLAFAWALMWVVNLLTRRMTRLAESRTGTSRARASQIKTLASVLRATGIGIVGFLAALQIMRDVFSFNLAPLLTSAGVAGVAIGLAAQTIVKDCLNGMLILIEDQYNVGDVVRLAGLSGTVESMSLRKTMLRDGDGTLYTIPNSQITNVANLTRDYSLATINVAVDFSADPDKTMQVLKAAAMSVRNDPAFSSVYLADPTLLGVDSIKGSQVIYPVQLKTKANQQWAAQRETQRRIRIALEQNEILPGDPLRIFSPGENSASTNGIGVPTNGHGPQEAAAARPDPTAAKPRETNPLTGESS